MPIVPSVFIRQGEVREALKRAEDALKPDVIRIRANLGSDWTDEPAIFFRVLLSDTASQPNNLQMVAQRAATRIIDEVKADDSGFHAYFNFRSESEQAKLNDPDWA